MRGIKYVSPSGTSDEALAAIYCVRSLVASGIPVHWVPLCDDSHYRNVPWRPELGIGALEFPTVADDPVYADVPQLVERCCHPCEYDTVLVQLPPEFWPVHFEPGSLNVGFASWSTERIPSHWPPLLNLATRVLVANPMNGEALKRCGVIVPVRVVSRMAHGAGEASPVESVAVELVTSLGD
jgi:hypothetical protein